MERYHVQCRHGSHWRTQEDTADLAEAQADAELLRWDDHPSRVWDAVTERVVKFKKGAKEAGICLKTT